MTATITPIHARRISDDLSEGTLSAQRINCPQVSTSLTADPLLLNTERLHRVDASQLPQGTGVSLGHCRTDMGVCMGHPECADRHCEGHPCNDVTDDERDPVALRWFLVGYLSFIAACMATVAYADHIYHWLTK